MVNYQRKKEEKMSKFFNNSPNYTSRNRLDDRTNPPFSSLNLFIINANKNIFFLRLHEYDLYIIYLITIMLIKFCRYII